MEAGGDIGGELNVTPCPDEAGPFLIVSILGKGYASIFVEGGLRGLRGGLWGCEYTEGGLGLVLISGLNFTLAI